jgi:hypothetical protein
MRLDEEGEQGEEKERKAHLSELVPVLFDEFGEVAKSLLTDLDVGALPSLHRVKTRRKSKVNWSSVEGKKERQRDVRAGQH